MTNKAEETELAPMELGATDPYETGHGGGPEKGDYVVVNLERFRHYRISVPRVDDLSIADLYGRITRIHESEPLPLDYRGKGEKLGTLMSVAFGRTGLDGDRLTFEPMQDGEFQLPAQLVESPWKAAKNNFANGEYERVAALVDAGPLPGSRWGWANLFSKSHPARCSVVEDTPEERSREAAIFKILRQLANLDYRIFEGPLLMWKGSYEAGFERRLEHSYTEIYHACAYDPATVRRKPLTPEQASILNRLGMSPAKLLELPSMRSIDLQQHISDFANSLRMRNADRADPQVRTRLAKKRPAAL